MDRIHMRNMRFSACHGVLPQEKKIPQEFIIDIKLFFNASKAAEYDDITLTVSYSDVYNAVSELIYGEPVNLIETLGYKLCDMILEKFPLICETEIEVKKIKPPMEGEFEYMSFKTRRSRIDG